MSAGKISVRKPKIRKKQCKETAVCVPSFSTAAYAGGDFRETDMPI